MGDRAGASLHTKRVVSESVGYVRYGTSLYARKILGVISCMGDVGYHYSRRILGKSVW